MLDNFNRLVMANLHTLGVGLSVTGYVCFCAFALAVVLGAIACLIRLYVPFIRIVAIGYIEFCRATPIFVQLLWVNYVWPELFGFPKSVVGAGIIALALQSSGYLAETFRSGIEGLPRGAAGGRFGGRHEPFSDPAAHRHAASPPGDGTRHRQPDDRCH